MSKSRKLIPGLLSFLPLLLFVVYMAVFLRFFITMFRHVGKEEVLPAMMFENMAGIMAVGLLMMLCTLGLLIYFIIHALNNNRVDSTERIVWVLVFIFAGMIGFPVYWYMRIWKDELPVKNY